MQKVFEKFLVSYMGKFVHIQFFKYSLTVFQKKGFLFVKNETFSVFLDLKAKQKSRKLSITIYEL